MKSGIEVKAVRGEKDNNVRIDFELSSEKMGSTYVFYEVVPYSDQDLITSIIVALTKIQHDLRAMSDMVTYDLGLYEEVRKVQKARLDSSSASPPDRKTATAGRITET